MFYTTFNVFYTEINTFYIGFVVYKSILYLNMFQIYVYALLGYWAPIGPYGPGPIWVRPMSKPIWAHIWVLHIHPPYGCVWARARALIYQRECFTENAPTKKRETCHL